MFRRISLYRMFVGLCILISAVYFADLGFAGENLGEQSQSPMMESADPFETAFNLDEVDLYPECIRHPHRPYPYKADQLCIEGSVTLMCVIDKEGKVRAAKVLEANPEGYFEKHALAAVKNYKFRPAMKGGEPVACVVKLPIIYKSW